MLAHPGSDSQLGIAVRCGRIDMIDSAFQEDLEDPIGAILLHAPQSSSSENHSGTLMAGLSKRTGRDHDITSELEWFRRWRGSESSAAQRGSDSILPRSPTRPQYGLFGADAARR